MERLDNETYGNIQKMLDRANLTKEQARQDLESGKFNETQYSFVIASMEKTSRECSDILASVEEHNHLYFIPFAFVSRANKIATAMKALSKVRP